MDPLVIVTVIGIVVPCAMTVYLGLSRRAHDSEKNEIERRLKQTEENDRRYLEKAEDLDKRLHANDVMTERLKGELAVEKAGREGLYRDVEMIKEKMATREQVSDLVRKVDELIRRGGGGSGRYGATQYPTPSK